MSLYVGRSNNIVDLIAGKIDYSSDRYAFIFKGYIQSTTPTDPQENDLWINLDELPTSFPVTGVKVYKDGIWQNSGSYSPFMYDLWIFKNNVAYENYYYDSNKRNWCLLADDREYVQKSGDKMDGNLIIRNENPRITLQEEYDNSDPNKAYWYDFSVDNGSLIIGHTSEGAGVASLDVLEVSSNGDGTFNWDFKGGTLTGIEISGNAETATKLKNPVTIATSGDVASSGVSFDGSSNITLSTKRRGCSVGQSSSTTTDPWYKFASVSNSTANVDCHIIFSVYNTYADTSTKMGILKAHLRTSSTGQWSSSELVWLNKTSSISLGDFVLVHNSSASPAVVELWCKCSTGYQGYNFDVISEGTRTSRSNSWTLYTTWSAGSASAPTSGYTQQTSTQSTLSNPVSGNASSATKLQTARTINGVSFDGTKNITIADSTKLPLAGGTMIGTINSSKTTGTYLAGSKGTAIINSTAGAGAYTTIFKTNSTNGRFTMSNYQGNLLVGYQTNSSVNAGTNSLTKQITLLNETGNSTFPGDVKVTGRMTCRNLTVGTRKIFIQSGTPSGAATGDIWIVAS